MNKEGKPMKKIIVSILLSIPLTLGVLWTSAAIASASTHLCNVNGTRYCFGDANIVVGYTVVQKNPSGDNARDITVTDIDSNCPVLYDGSACDRVYLSYFTGNRLISTSDSPGACSDIEIGTTNASTGSVWFRETETSGNVEFVSQMCYNNNAPDLAMGDNNHGDNWITSTKQSGFYWTLGFF
jgi:hypothetical protein